MKRGFWIPAALGAGVTGMCSVALAGGFAPGPYVRTAEGVLIGPARDAEEAGSLCNTMRARGAVCAVVSIGADGQVPGAAPTPRSSPPPLFGAAPPPTAPPPPRPSFIPPLPAAAVAAALAPPPPPPTMAPPTMAPPKMALPATAPGPVPSPVAASAASVPPPSPVAAVSPPKPTPPVSPPAPASANLVSAPPPAPVMPKPSVQPVSMSPLPSPAKGAGSVEGLPIRPPALTAATGIAISLAERRLFLFEGDRLAGSWPVAVGKPATPSPTGTTEIIRKRVNPTWVPTAQMRARDPRLPHMVPPGPDNPLGQHALDLAWDAYRIHGTNAPRSVGHAVSSGCFRMLPAHVSELFGKVGVGTQVTVFRDTLTRQPAPVSPIPAPDSGMPVGPVIIPSAALPGPAAG